MKIENFSPIILKSLYKKNPYLNDAHFFLNRFHGTCIRIETAFLLLNRHSTVQVLNIFEQCVYLTNIGLNIFDRLFLVGVKRSDIFKLEEQKHDVIKNQVF